MKLPLKCSVEYLNEFIDAEDALALYNELIEKYDLKKSVIVLNSNGKQIVTESIKILFLSDRLIKEKSHPEQIHGKTYRWDGLMATLKEKVEKITNKKYEIAMCIYYPNGNYFAPYHSDPETSGKDTILPSLSLGACRKFSFKELESGVDYNLDLENGSLLIMGEYCQSKYSHSLLKDGRCQEPRINITFREASFQ